MTVAELAIEVESDVARAVDGLGDVGNAALGAGSDIARMGEDAEATARILSINADSVDDLAGKTGKATGALGALAGGLEAVGLEKYAAGLQGAAIATDFASGAGDALNLVMESTIIKNARQTAATVASTVATKAAAAGNAVLTTAQFALNAAMSANPIGLVVIALTALTAGVVLAYKRSETFREIIQKVGEIGSKAIGTVVDVVEDLIGFVKDKLPGAFNTAKSIITTAVGIYTLPIRTLIGVVQDVIGFVKDRLPGAFNTAKSAITNAADAILSPFRNLFDLIERIINKIKDIKLPDITPGFDLPLIGRAAAVGPAQGATFTPAQAQPVQYVDQRSYHVTGVVDVVGAYQQLKSLMERGERLFGPPLVVEP